MKFGVTRWYKFFDNLNTNQNVTAFAAHAIVTLALPDTHTSCPRNWWGDPAYIALGLYTWYWLACCDGPPHRPVKQRTGRYDSLEFSRSICLVSYFEVAGYWKWLKFVTNCNYLKFIKDWKYELRHSGHHCLNLNQTHTCIASFTSDSRAITTSPAPTM